MSMMTGSDRRVIQAGCSQEHHPAATAAKITRAQSGGEYLVVHARELDVEPGVHILQGHSRSLLRGLEQAYRSALAHHVHWPARLGSPMLISETASKAHCISASNRRCAWWMRHRYRSVV